MSSEKSSWPGRVEQVEGDPVPLEGHHRAGHRDAALLLDLHPVRARPPRLPARLDLAGQMDRAALQQQLLGQRGLARVGVRDDGEGAAVGHRRVGARLSRAAPPPASRPRRRSGRRSPSGPPRRSSSRPAGA